MIMCIYIYIYIYMYIFFQCIIEREGRREEGGTEAEQKQNRGRTQRRRPA